MGEETQNEGNRNAAAAAVGVVAVAKGAVEMDRISSAERDVELKEIRPDSPGNSTLGVRDNNV